MVPQLEQPELRLVVERVLLAHELDDVARLGGLGERHRGEGAVHHVHAEEVLAEERALLVQDRQRRLQRRDPLVAHLALGARHVEAVLPRVQPELLPLHDLEELPLHLETLLLAAGLVLVVDLHLLLDLLDREEAHVEGALLLALGARVVVLELAVVVQHEVPPLPRALHVLHRRVPRLLLAEVPLLDDGRHLLVHRLLVVVAVEVHLHLVGVDELRLAQRLLELVGPHLPRLLDVRRDLQEDPV